MKAAATCMPRLARGCRASSASARPAAPAASLLERIRDAVFRLIMLSAAVSRPPPPPRPRQAPAAPRPAPEACRARDDSARSEAVEECIEFLKRSSAEGEAVTAAAPAAAAAAAAGDLAGRVM